MCKIRRKVRSAATLRVQVSAYTRRQVGTEVKRWSLKRLWERRRQMQPGPIGSWALIYASLSGSGDAGGATFKTLMFLREGTERRGMQSMMEGLRNITSGRIGRPSKRAIYERLRNYLKRIEC